MFLEHFSDHQYTVMGRKTNITKNQTTHCFKFLMMKRDQINLTELATKYQIRLSQMKKRKRELREERKMFPRRTFSAKYAIKYSSHVSNQLIIRECILVSSSIISNDSLFYNCKSKKLSIFSETARKSYACDICGKIYSQFAQFNRHTRTHLSQFII